MDAAPTSSASPPAPAPLSAPVRVAFVDDDARVLSGIRRALRAQGCDWDVSVLGDAEALLVALAPQPFDVVVSDLRMPGADGMALLARVRASCPQALRVLLSGCSEREVSSRALQLAHRFLCKPVDGAQLVDAVQRAMARRALLDAPSLRAAVAAVDRLPAQPTVFLELLELLDGPDGDAFHVAALVGRDPGIATRVLQLANSAFFCRGHPIPSVHVAVTRLGLSTVRELVLAGSVFVPGPGTGPEIEVLQSRALSAALLAPNIAGDRAVAEFAGASALLAEVGALLPSSVTAAADPAAAGAYLLGLWGLPWPMVEAVAFRHHPMRTLDEGFGLTGVVHVSTALVAGREPDAAYVAATGIEGRLPEWRQLAQELGAG